MKRDDRSVESYVASVLGAQRVLLDAIRSVFHEQFPDIPEGIRYGMLDYPGLANLAAQKHYVAVYVKPETLARHKDNFPGTSCGKSCLRFKNLDQFDSAALKALLTDVRA